MSTQIIELLRAISDDDPQMRESAVRALGTLIGTEQSDPATDINNMLVGTKPSSLTALEAIHAALDDSDWGVRQSAAEMAIKLETDQAEVAKLMLDEDSRNPDPEIRLGACWSMVLLHDERAVTPLIQLLYVDDPILIASAADALGDTNDQRAIPALLNFVEHADQDVREAAQDALERLGYQAEG